MSKQKTKIAFILFAISIILVASTTLIAQPLSTLQTCDIPFVNEATGGSLVLFETLNRNARYVSIETTAGEPAEMVAERLAKIINTTDPFRWGIPSGQELVTASNGTVKNLLGDSEFYLLAGTELGLGIPEPPTFLTCNYDAKSSKAVFKWRNPPGNYDSIAVILNWDNYNHRGGTRIPGSSESYTVDLSKYRESPGMINDLDVWVVGFRNKLPSNATALHIKGYVQEDLFGIPFSNGVSPNWATWPTGVGMSEIQFLQGTRDSHTHTNEKGKGYNPVSLADKKPFYQIIKTTSRDVKGGIWRKFIGLTPGHTYKISSRLSTLSEDSLEKDWSFSLHVTYNKPDGTDLTTQQLAGLAVLPDGSSGSNAGQIALYKPGVITSGNFIERTTGEEGPDRNTGNITLPAKVDTITVWTRQSGLTSGLALDWIKLEDISSGLSISAESK